MLTLTTTQAVLAGAILALWLAAAAWAVASGVSMRRRAVASAEACARLGAVLGASPALPLTVRADQRVEAPERLAEWLGLPRVPNFLGDFAANGAGLSAADAAALVADVAAAQRTAKRFARAVRAVGSGRALMIRGGPAPADVQPGGALLWVFDASESQAEIDRLAGEGARLTRAFETLSRLIEAAPVPMWHRGPDLRLTMVNRAYVEAVDAADAEDVIARGVELVEPSASISPIAAAVAARDLGEVRSREVPATIAGQRRSVRIVDVPLGEAGVAGYALDNDELDRSRAAFRRFVETQRDTLDRLSAGVAQFAPDRTLTFSNQPFQRIFAIRPEWVADRPEFDRVLERMREAGRVPEARDFPAWKAERRLWFTAEGVSEESWLLAGGTHLRVVAQPLPDGGLLLIFEDRTEQVQLASARDTLLRVREATFDNLFEAVGVFAADGRLHLWNNRFREVWGFEEAFLAAHPRVDALAEAAAPGLATPARASLIRELVRAATVERQSRSGRVALKDGRHFEFAAVPLPDGNALFTMLDITDSRRIERALRDRAEALEAADKVKSSFVANMSYELRTPLTSIGGFAEMLDQGFAGELSGQAKDYVAAILQSVGVLGAQVDDVLRLTQSDAGLAGGDRETVDLMPLLAAAAAQAEAAAADKGQAFARDFDSRIGRVEGNAAQLRAMLDGLLALAVEAAPDGGRVLLHGGEHGGGVRLVVSDDGAGVTTEAQVSEARAIVAAHGGSLELVAAPGEGSAIAIALPR